MKKEVGVYFFAVLLLVGVFLAVYFFNIKPTGFAVFSQSSDFSAGIYNNTLYNGSAVVLNLSTNMTSGDYISPVIDSNNTNTTWNNLTWTGNIPENSSLSFQATTCSNPNCSDANFTELTNINNVFDLSMLPTDQYLEYKTLFLVQNLNVTSPSLTGVSYSYTSTENNFTNQTNQTNQITTAVGILQPSGIKNSTSSIPLTFIAAGNNITCVYNVEDDENNFVVTNQTLSTCNNSTFSVANDGDYTLNFYVNGPSGTASAFSYFSVNSSQTQTTQQNQENTTQTNQTQQINQTNQTVTNTTNTTVPPVIVPVIQISLTPISSQEMAQGDSKNLTLTVQNTGNQPVSSCSLTFTGDNSSLASTSSSPQNINAGGSVSYPFLVDIPLNATPDTYTIGLSVTCSETFGSEDLSIDVVQKKLDFNITRVQRTSKNNVKVDYSLKDLTGSKQNVSILFYLIDNSSLAVANISQNETLNANKTEKYNANIPINSSLNGNLTLSATVNAETYSSSVLEPITLGAPIGGFVIFGGQGGAVNIIVLVAIVVILGAVFFFVRKGKTKKITKDYK